MTCHLVYPVNPASVAAPWSIGNLIARTFLRCGIDVVVHGWDSDEIISTEENDILIGHPHPEPGHTFELSLDGKACKRIALSPWNGLPEVREMIARVAPRVERYYALCGEHWRQSAHEIAANVWQVNGFVDAANYPRMIRNYNEAGKRRCLYVGCTLPCKGIEQLARIAADNPCAEWAHVGPGTVPGFREYGYVEQWPLLAARVGFDFLVCTGVNDANPTTVLEAACTGMIPVAPESCGWGTDVVRRPDDLEWLLNLTSTEELRASSRLIRRNVVSWYAPADFAETILSACVA